MNRQLLILILILFSCSLCVHAVTHAQRDKFGKLQTEETILESETDSTVTTSFTLLDTLKSQTLLRTIFEPYQLITNPYNAIGEKMGRKNLPTVKEIVTRSVKNDSWKFWLIIFILLYIAMVRIINRNNFRVFLLSVFNLKLSEKIWDNQRSIFNFIILQLFAIYIFIAALFINYVLELKSIKFMDTYFLQYLTIIAVLVGVYICKFIIHAMLGALLKMEKLGVSFVSNTVSINNFLSLVILPFIIFIIYNESNLWAMILSQTVIAIFFISIIYRLVRLILLSKGVFNFPKSYLFVYLCALEILPWFVIIKFINSYQV